MAAWGALALSMLTGGRVDYLPGARRPWHIEAFGRTARGATLDETLHRLLHRPGRTIHIPELKLSGLCSSVENFRKELLKTRKAVGNFGRAVNSHRAVENQEQLFRDATP